ncbi:rCG50001 [Rattus norvegicus]|uniref:RCG50001 n=1 Tax=Rattus norvegicus TaxID=10116 RepID=A6JV80_RAT|nr:rCG50001 [Rattus norvegicus]
MYVFAYIRKTVEYLPTYLIGRGGVFILG